MKTLLICSGGLDSVVLAYRLQAQNALSHLLSFDYGQRHKKELEFAARTAARLNVSHDILELGTIGRHLTGSALTDDIDVPDGHYAQETMNLTIVPNRNAIMLTLAFGIAQAKGLEQVALAVHGGDHFIYPDCRPGFIKAFAAMQKQALGPDENISLLAPYLDKTKADIVQEGQRFNVPLKESWSCYKGGSRHCGRCGTCVERREAFHLAACADPTDYEDRNFWIEALKSAPSERKA